MENFFTKKEHERTEKISEEFHIKWFLNSSCLNYNDEDEFVVVWYETIFGSKNTGDSVTTIPVLFLNIDSNVEFKYDTSIRQWEDSGSVIKVSIPINYLHKLPIGSIWKKGIFQGDFAFETYDVSFDPMRESSFSVYSIAESIWSIFNDKEEDKKKKPFETRGYLDILTRDKNKLINIPYKGKNIIIHPISLFIAYYGSNMNIKGIISTYSWKKVQDMLCINTKVDEYEKESSDKYIVLPRKFDEGDVPFLYHLKYDEYCKVVVKNLVNSINVSKTNGMPVSIGFWHQEEVKFEFKGIRIGNSILCTSITGLNQPTGEQINVVKESRRSASLESGEDFEEKEYAFYNNNSLDIDEEFMFSGDQVDNLTSINVTRDMKIIGQKRKVNVIKVIKNIHRDSSKIIPQEEVSGYSVGDIQGNGPTGQANNYYNLENVEVSTSRFQEVWKSAIILRRSKRATVEWYTTKSGFNESNHYKGISLSNINNAERKSHRLKHVLVIKVSISGYSYFILEFGDGLKGLVCKADKNEDFINSKEGLAYVLRRAIESEGVFNGDFIRSFNGKVFSFKHVKPKVGNNRWILNGIDKFNVVRTSK